MSRWMGPNGVLQRQSRALHSGILLVVRTQGKQWLSIERLCIWHVDTEHGTRPDLHPRLPSNKSPVMAHDQFSTSAKAYKAKTMMDG